MKRQAAGVVDVDAIAKIPKTDSGNLWEVPELLGENTGHYVEKIKIYLPAFVGGDVGLLVLRYWYDGMYSFGWGQNPAPKFPVRSHLWLTQWFENRLHFQCLMRTRGYSLIHQLHDYESLAFPMKRTASDLWQIFDAYIIATNAVKKADMLLLEFKCQVYHKTHRGVPYFQCAQCLQTNPNPQKPRQTMDFEWRNFVDQHLDLLLEHFTKLPEKTLSRLALHMDESWLECSTDWW